MRFLVLGGNGYLGAKAIHCLLENGHSVVYTKRVSSNISRLSDVGEHIVAIPATVEAITVLFQYVRIDWVINMACNYGRADRLYDQVIEANIEFPLGALNVAVEYGIKNFMTIGTGLPDDFNMYSFSKKMFSEFGEFYVQKHHINFINAKLEMFYESDEPENRFLPLSIKTMMRNEPLDLTEGTQHRDIIMASDVVEAIVHITHAGLKGHHIIPVGTGEAPTIMEIIEYIHERLKSKSELRYGVIPSRKDEPDCCADTSFLSQIGFTCKYKWKQGIDKMIKEVQK